MSYYTKIDGVQYDTKLLAKAEGRTLSEEDIWDLLHASRDSGKVTQTEVNTLRYINDNATWTSEVIHVKFDSIVQTLTKYGEALS